MKFILVSLFCLSLVFPALSVSDTSLIDSNKTLGYFLMPATDFRHYSSGLVFNQSRGEGSDLEVIYTSYRSVYLLTSNVTQVNAHLKNQMLKLGPLTFSSLFGVGLMYSPAVGGGLIGDVGGVVQFRPVDWTSFSTPLFVSIFSDGVMLNAYPGFAQKLPLLSNSEIFGGLKIDARVSGNVSQIESTGTGAVTLYYLLGFRTAL